MKYFFPLAATAIIAATTFSSCKKDDPEPLEPEAAITIASPADNDTITGATFQISGSISATAATHGYTAKLIRQSTGAQVFYQEVEEHAASFAIDMPATPTGVTEAGNLKLIIEVILDHEGSSAIRETTFYYVP